MPHSSRWAENLPTTPTFREARFDNLLDKLDPEAAAARPEPEPKGKDPKAVKAGRKGGKRGGKARAQSLTPEKRKLIAKRAAKARWRKMAV